jgi:SAM-dependent methyltransferase
MQTRSALTRGDRLHPDRSSRNYWLLVQLRDGYTRLIKKHLGESAIGRVIDYGCGNMPYRSLFNAAEYLGADFPGNELAEISLGADGRIAVESGTSDVVVSSQVLEHVADVPGYLAEAKRVLKGDGILFLSTHGVWKYHPDPGDYWRWTCDGLVRTIAAAGFDVIEMQGILGPEATALQLWLDAVNERIPKGLRKSFYRYMQWRIRRADQRCNETQRNRDACVYVLVARPT